jgi:hypothetical protein
VADGCLVARPGLFANANAHGVWRAAHGFGKAHRWLMCAKIPISAKQIGVTEPGTLGTELPVRANPKILARMSSLAHMRTTGAPRRLFGTLHRVTLLRRYAGVDTDVCLGRGVCVPVCKPMPLS